MKRFGNLYPQITTFANLLDAAKKAQRGKRYRETVLPFNARLERELFQLQRELRSQTYRPGPYKTIKSQLYQTRHGVNFVGFRILPDRLRVRAHNLRVGRDRIQRLRENLADGSISATQAKQSLQSWNAHLAHGDTWRLRQQIYNDLPVELRPNVE